MPWLGIQLWPLGLLVYVEPRSLSHGVRARSKILNPVSRKKTLCRAKQTHQVKWTEESPFAGAIVARIRWRGPLGCQAQGLGFHMLVTRVLLPKGPGVRMPDENGAWKRLCLQQGVNSLILQRGTFSQLPHWPKPYTACDRKALCLCGIFHSHPLPTHFLSLSFLLSLYFNKCPAAAQTGTAIICSLPPARGRWMDTVAF